MALKASQFNDLCSVKHQEVYFENPNAFTYRIYVSRQQRVHMQITILMGQKIKNKKIIANINLKHALKSI